MRTYEITILFDAESLSEAGAQADTLLPVLDEHFTAWALALATYKE